MMKRQHQQLQDEMNAYYTRILAGIDRARMEIRPWHPLRGWERAALVLALLLCIVGTVRGLS